MDANEIQEAIVADLRLLEGVLRSDASAERTMEPSLEQIANGQAGRLARHILRGDYPSWNLVEGEEDTLRERLFRLKLKVDGTAESVELANLFAEEVLRLLSFFTPIQRAMKAA